MQRLGIFVMGIVFVGSTAHARSPSFRTLQQLKPTVGKLQLLKAKKGVYRAKRHLKGVTQSVLRKEGAGAAISLRTFAPPDTTFVKQNIARRLSQALERTITPKQISIRNKQELWTSGGIGAGVFKVSFKVNSGRTSLRGKASSDVWIDGKNYLQTMVGSIKMNEQKHGSILTQLTVY